MTARHDTEAALVAAIRRAASGCGAVLMRNSAGVAVTPRGRAVRFGLSVGAADLIGWVTRDGVAVFVALEVKTARGRTTAAQERFLAAVRAAGGIAAVCRSVDDAMAALGGKKDAAARAAARWEDRDRGTNGRADIITACAGKQTKTIRRDSHGRDETGDR